MAQRKSLFLATRSPLATEIVPRSLRTVTTRSFATTEWKPTQIMATTLFRTEGTTRGRRSFKKSGIARLAQVETELPEVAVDAEGNDVEDEVDESEAALEDTEEGASAEEEDEDEESDSSSDEESEYADYSELDNSYTPTSYDGISTRPFPAEIRTKLLEKVDPNIVEIKPDGYLYLPEIQYRRILNNAFGPGGWALMPRTPLEIDPQTSICSREYALYAFGRFVSQAGGEQPISDSVSPTTASEAAKSQALMRCCKDLGIASELWEPTFIREWKKVYAVQEWYEHVKTGKKTLLWRRRDRVLGYPYKESPAVGSTTQAAAPAQQQQRAYQQNYAQQNYAQQNYAQQPNYAPQQQAQPKVAQPVRPAAQAAPPKPAPAAAPQQAPPQAPAQRPTLYTPYKSYTTRASTNPMSATRPVYAPKPAPQQAQQNDEGELPNY